jgi:8-oxo-dGTP pyrophosphatase MutT (NUDIX family)
MHHNPFYPLRLLEEDGDDPSSTYRLSQTPASSSRGQRRALTLPTASTPPIPGTSYTAPATSHTAPGTAPPDQYALMTSPRTPVTYPERLATPFTSPAAERAYQSVLSSIPSASKYRRYRSSYPLRSTAGLEVIESYAVVLISYARGEDEPTVLLGHRRESIEFSNLIRGLYEPEELHILLSLMSIPERRRLVHHGFDALWNDYWPLSSQPYHSSKARHIARLSYERIRPFLPRLLEIVPSAHTDTEWLFPRGRSRRRGLGEEIAVKEFEEETSLSLRDALKVPVEVYREFYYGSNGSQYATTHYVYMTEAETLPPRRHAPSAIRPWMVSNDFDVVSWFTLDELKGRLNSFRVEMISRMVEVTRAYRRRGNPGVELPSLELSTSSRRSSTSGTSGTPSADCLTPPTSDCFRLKDAS